MKLNPRKTSRNAAPVDCADCRSSGRCWDNAALTHSDIQVQRHDLLAKGTLLLKQGEPFSGAYIVARGCLCLRETLTDGTERVVGFRVPGDIVGLEGWTPGRYPYTAEAADSVAVCRLTWPRAAASKIEPRSTAGKSGSSGNTLLQRLLVKSITQLDRASRPWPGLPAVERVAEFIEDFAHRTGADSARSNEKLGLPMTRAQLGSYLGLAEETVVRALADLRRRPPA